VPAEHEPCVAAALGPTVRVRGTEDFRTEAWRKLLANLLGNPIGTLTLRNLDVMLPASRISLAVSSSRPEPWPGPTERPCLTTRSYRCLW
jgi:hypothetical protein